MDEAAQSWYEHQIAIVNRRNDELEKLYADAQAALAEKDRRIAEKDQQLCDEALAFNHANEVVAKLEASLAEAERTIKRLTSAEDVMSRRIETLVGVTCKRCERGDKLYVEPSTGFYTHTLGGNYCDAHKLHSLLNTPQSIAARAALAPPAEAKEGGSNV